MRLKCCIYLLLLLAMLPGWIQAHAGIQTAAAKLPPSEFLEPVISLEKLAGQQTIGLRGDSAAASVSMPLSGRVKLERAELELHFTNSPALLTHRSQISLELNGHQIAVAHLNGRQPVGSLKTTIPVRFFKPGFNTLSFHASQHYLDSGCESPGAPELWTQIDATASRLKFRYRNSRIDAGMDRLPLLMDSHIWHHYDIQLLTAENIARNDMHVEAGSLLAQGVALQTRFLPVRIHHQQARKLEQAAKTQRLYRHPKLGIPQRGMDAILFGTYEELQPLLGTEAFDTEADQWISIERMDGDRTRFLMIVAGRDAEALKAAALEFARLAPALKSAHPASRDADRIIRSFSSLNFQTWSMQGMNGSKDLRLWLAPEQLAPPLADIELDIHMSYAAGIREDSSLNVLVNNHFVQAIFLNRPEGQHYRHYKVKIPPHALLPGENIIRFEAALTPAISGNCTMIRTESLRLTLFEDSHVYLPTGRQDRAMRLPDLRALARAGYPFGFARDDASLPQAEILMPSVDSGWLSTAWTLTARLAQSRRLPIRFRLIDDLAASTSRNILIMGFQNQINASLRADMPLHSGKQAHGLRLMTDNSGIHLISQFRHQHKWVTLFAPAASNDPGEASWQLTGFDLWGGLQGDTCIWPANTAEPESRCFLIKDSSPYDLGRQGGEQ